MGIKISALSPVTAALLTDFFPVDQGAPTTQQETLQQVLTLFSQSLLPLSGGTMTGNLFLNVDPTTALQAATKQYVDNFAAGIKILLAARLATTGNLTATYANGAAGVGATLTNSGAMAALTVDSVLTVVGDRILVKDQTTSFQNGIYSVTAVGSGVANWVLTRVTDYDQTTEIVPGTVAVVNVGTVNAATSWIETATVSAIGTDPILFSPFTSSPTNFLKVANNLSDVASASTSRINLGLGDGDVISSGGLMTIDTNKVTYAQIQQASAHTLLGNSTAGLANVQEITLGAGLSFSGTTLNASSTFTNVQVFTTPGVNTFNIPATTSSALIYLWGAGGGGAGVALTSGGPGGGGGGGGAYLSKLSTITPGGTITINLGTGGTGGAAGASNPGGAGGNSTASGGGLVSTLTANGGAGGVSTSGTSTGGRGGASGTATNGDLNVSGTPGFNGLNGIFAGNGGTGAHGGGGGRTTIGVAGAGENGSAPAGGGGGGFQNNAGGNGANGMCILYYSS